MHISSHASKNNETVFINLHGKFVLDSIIDFWEVCHQFKEYRPKYVINLNNVNAVDNAALGMLLNVKYHFNDPTIKLVNCPIEIKAVLDLYHFQSQFGLT